jgi:hypothetical protein
MPQSKGGVYIESEPIKAFDLFMNNSDCLFLTSGGNSLILYATVDSNEFTHYKSLNLSNIDQPIKKILIKIVLLRTSEISINILDRSIYTSTPAAFDDEVTIQNEIYWNSITYLKPICPSIIYTNIYKNSSELMEFIKKVKNEDTLDYLYTILEYLKLRLAHGVGIIVMDFVNGYESLEKVIDSKDYVENVESQFRFLLLRLIKETGYTHGDFHVNNMLLNKDATDYFSKIKGAPLLIDFGMSHKLPPDILNEIDKLFLKHEYTEIIKLVCSLKRKDEQSYHKFPYHYGWLCNELDPSINEEIKKFFEEFDDSNKVIGQKFQSYLEEIGPKVKQNIR